MYCNKWNKLYKHLHDYKEDHEKGSILNVISQSIALSSPKLKVLQYFANYWKLTSVKYLHKYKGDH